MSMPSTLVIALVMELLVVGISLGSQPARQRDDLHYEVRRHWGPAFSSHLARYDGDDFELALP